jgi:predicted phosphodiesterase
VRIAALYDVHGNLPALQAVLAEADRADVEAVVCGGDVSAGPMPAECLDVLRARGAVFVRGNADRELAGWPAERLDAPRLEFLAGLPTSVSLEAGGLGPVLFCHGSPRRDDEILTRLTSDDRAAAAVAGVAERVVVCGHTHVQFDRVVAGRRLVNAGSVGLPYEGRRGAFWALLGPGVELRRTEYDLEAAVDAILATGYPDADQVASWLLEPVAADEASSYFEGLALGS